jgi:hypothetical protein
MEAESFGRVAFRAILFVSDDRVTGIGKVDADLVAAPGFQREFNQSPNLAPA